MMRILWETHNYLHSLHPPLAQHNMAHVGVAEAHVGVTEVYRELELQNKVPQVLLHITVTFGGAKVIILFQLCPCLLVSLWE